MKNFILILFLIIIFPTKTYALDTFQAKDKTVMLVPPEGYTDVLELSDDFKNFASKFVPENNQLLAYYLPNSEARKFLLPNFDFSQALQYDRKFMIQTSKDALERPLKEEDFLTVKKLILEQQSALYKKVKSKTENLANNAMNEVLSNLDLNDVQAKFQLSNILPLNDFSETEKSVQFGVIMKVQLDMNSSDINYSEPQVIVNESSLVAVNGILFYLYGYSDYTSEEDVIWTQTSTKNWTNSFITSNQHLPSFSTSHLTPDTTNAIIEKGISGGVAGGFIALVIALFSGFAAWLKKFIKRK